jgi:hypothetical protein
MFHGGMRPGVSLYRVSDGTYLGSLESNSQSSGWRHFMVFSYAGDYVYVSTNLSTIDISYPTNLKNLQNTAFAYNSGANLPWEGYGHDLGLSPWGGAADGFSSVAGLAKLRADFSYLHQQNVKVVRIFLFCDLRSGVSFNADGSMTFQDVALTDFRALLTTAQAYEIRLIPVLFDYTLADGVATENGFVVGEHPELITDPAKKQALLNLFAAFFQCFGANKNIWCWDVMNEPEYMSAVSAASAKTFIGDFVSLIHQQAPGAKVTLGCCNRGDLANWTMVGLDIYQFHYYDKMENQFPFDFPSANLQLNKPVLIGEIEPTDIVKKLDTAKADGYAGALFWSLNADYNFRAVASDFQQWILTH